MREDAASVWRRRRHGALAALLVLAVLVPITADVNAPSRTVVRTLDLAAGSYYVDASVFVINTSGALIGERHKSWMLEHGEWRPTAGTIDPGAWLQGVRPFVLRDRPARTPELVT